MAACIALGVVSVGWFGLQGKVVVLALGVDEEVPLRMSFVLGLFVDGEGSYIQILKV